MTTATNNSQQPKEDRFAYVFNTEEGDANELALLLSLAIMHYITKEATDFDFDQKSDALISFVDRLRRVSKAA